MPSLLFFNDDNKIDCFRIDILQDDIKEDPEDLKIILSGPDIEDRDGHVTETFNREYRMVIVDDSGKSSCNNYAFSK